MKYDEFLKSKVPDVAAVGPEPGEIHERLFPFERTIVQWAIRKGRAAIFADCGMGKTIMQAEWLRHVSGGQSLIVAPLGVQDQTIAEAAHLGMDVVRVTTPSDAAVQITNYQRLESFIGHPYSAIVLDESSILKWPDHPRGGRHRQRPRRQ